MFEKFFGVAVEEAEQLQKEKKNKSPNTSKSNIFKKYVTTDNMKQNFVQLESSDALLKRPNEIFQLGMDEDSRSSYEGGENNDSQDKNNVSQKEINFL
jgi:hypothetical protein